MELRLSTSHHPQTDGQIERVNPVLERYLHCQLSSEADDWVDSLWLAEFAYNNYTHSSLGFPSIVFGFSLSEVSMLLTF